MFELPTLYDHQTDLKDKLRESLKRHGSSICCVPPGVGKTRIAKWVLAAAANREPNDGQSGRVVFAVHRRGLVDNASDSFAEEPKLEHGVVMSDRETAWRHRVQVASIDTLISWYCSDEGYTAEHTFDLVVFDECHSHLSKLKTWFKQHSAKRKSLGLKPAFLIGLSATPECEGLSDAFKEIVTGPSADWLIENGYLSPFRYYQAKHLGRLDDLVKSGDTYTNKSLDSAFKDLSGEYIRDWKQFAEGRPTVGFFSRLTHAAQARDELRKHGIRAEYIDGKTPDDERRAILDHLNEGRVDYVANVGVVERGVDVPAIGCVQLCTAIGGVVRYKQIVGRGSRVHPEKTDVIVLDHGGNIKRNGFFEDEISWTLDNTRKASQEGHTRPSIDCPKCGRVYRGGSCTCGYEPTSRERKAQGLKFDGKELTEIVRKERSTGAAKSNEQLMVSALFIAGKSNRTFGQAYHIAKSLARRQGTDFVTPRRVEIAGSTYEMPQRGSYDCSRRVSDLYPVTGRR